MTEHYQKVYLKCEEQHCDHGWLSFANGRQKCHICKGEGYIPVYITTKESVRMAAEECAKMGEPK